MSNFNLEKRILLMDKEGAFLYNIDQRQAGYLLRTSQAELVLEYPPKLRLKEDIDWKKSEIKVNNKQVNCDREGYGNYCFQNQEGQNMFLANSKKVLWYLNRNLVDIVSVDPPIVRFKFVPNGRTDDEYYLSPKENQCVVCGSKEHFTKHHVVPYCFRKFMSEEIKGHTCHDVLMLCVDCHEEYEVYAAELKLELSVKHGVNLNTQPKPNSHLVKLAKQANLLLVDDVKIPQSRKDQIRELISLHLGRSVETADLIEISNNFRTLNGEENYYGLKVLEHWDIQEFIEMWRNHFLNKMEPEFMPELWNVQKSCYRTSK